MSELGHRIWRQRGFRRRIAAEQVGLQTIIGGFFYGVADVIPAGSIGIGGAAVLYLGVSYPVQYFKDKREANREACERGRQALEDVKRARRDARDSLAYEVLAQYVIFENDPAMGADRDYEPLLSINLDQLTDTQIDILDAYLESAYDMMSIWTGDLTLNKDHVTNSGLRMVHEFAIEAASLLLVDSNLRQMRDHQAKFA